MRITRIFYSRNMFSKRTQIAVLFIFLCMMFSVYMTYFNHGPPEDIMEANRKSNDLHSNSGSRDVDDTRKSKREDSEIDENEEEIDEKEIESDKSNPDFVDSVQAWEKFIKENNYVSIGDIYNTCDVGKRVQVGKTIMLPDKKKGGIMSRTFLNYTFEDDYNEGEFRLEVKYNNKELYDNHWDMCTLDEEKEDRMIFCPYKANSGWNWVKDRKIPGFLPKGKYETKAWVTNQDDKTVLCGFSTFVL